MAKLQYLIGIDEVGRGPLAGPVCIGLAIIKIKDKKKIYKALNGIKDSKKLSAKKREFWRLKIKKLEKDKIFKSAILFGSAEKIDKFGISSVISKLIKQGLSRVGAEPDNSKILLDGGLKAPKIYRNQKTIIKGDEKEKIISAGSILAKQKRDKLMIKLDKQFSNFGFADHKGYGTKKHIENIKKIGPTKIHRLSYLKSFI